MRVVKPLSLVLALSVVVIVGVSACGSDANVVECRYDTSCDRFTGGRCVENPETGNRFCTYPDAACDSGMRWSDQQVEASISGECVVPESLIDASVDAPSISPDGRWPQGTWSAPVKLAFSSETEREWYAHESRDGLELYYTLLPAGSTMPDIYKVTRAGATAEWGTTRIPINAVNQTTQADTTPALSPDGLELYVSRAGFLYVSNRSSTTASWDTPQPLELEGNRPVILDDGLTMYYRDTSGAYVCTELCRVRLTRPSLTAAWGSPHVEQFATSYYVNVSVSGDGLMALLSSPMSQSGAAPVAISTRATRDDAWDPPKPIPELSSYSDVFQAAWSSSTITMYLSMGTDQEDIYVSHLEP